MTDFTEYDAETHPEVKLEDDWNNLLARGLISFFDYLIIEENAITLILNGDTMKIYDHNDVDSVIWEDDGVSFWTLIEGEESNDSENEQSGEDCYKVVLHPNQGETTFDFYHDYAEVQDLSTQEHIEIWVDHTYAHKIWFYTENYAGKTNGFYYAINEEAEWSLLKIPKSDFSEQGSPDWSQIKCIRIENTSNPLPPFPTVTLRYDLLKFATSQKELIQNLIDTIESSGNGLIVIKGITSLDVLNDLTFSGKIIIKELKSGVLSEYTDNLNIEVERVKTLPFLINSSFAASKEGSYLKLESTTGYPAIETKQGYQTEDSRGDSPNYDDRLRTKVTARVNIDTACWMFFYEPHKGNAANLQAFYCQANSPTHTAISSKHNDTETTEITSQDWTTDTEFKIDYEKNTHVKFYINGELKVTHTTYVSDSPFSINAVESANTARIFHVKFPYIIFA